VKIRITFIIKYPYFYIFLKVREFASFLVGLVARVSQYERNNLFSLLFLPKPFALRLTLQLVPHLAFERYLFEKASF
jgi:hypothetical protein